MVLAGWSVWENFDPPLAVKLGLLVTSLWLVVVGMVMQLVPARSPAGSTG